jgi:hypothetical protein
VYNYQLPEAAKAAMRMIKMAGIALEAAARES